MAAVVFIHGLNTFGDDRLHLGPATFGLMHENIERAFLSREIDFLPLTGLGAGSPDELAERALGALEKIRYFDGRGEFHLLGQSIGGLVCRALATRSELKGRVRTIFTLGTPHRGTEAARLGIELRQRHPLISRVFAATGYDTGKRAHVFKNFLPEVIDAFNIRYPVEITPPVVSLLCEVPGAKVSWPLLALQKRLRALESERDLRGDGLILSQSQRWGECVGPFALDHLQQLGFFFHLSPLKRRESQAEFSRLIDVIANRLKDP